VPFTATAENNSTFFQDAIDVGTHVGYTEIVDEGNGPTDTNTEKTMTNATKTFNAINLTNVASNPKADLEAFSIHFGINVTRGDGEDRPAKKSDFVNAITTWRDELKGTDQEDEHSCEHCGVRAPANYCIEPLSHSDLSGDAICEACHAIEAAEHAEESTPAEEEPTEEPKPKRVSPVAGMGLGQASAFIAGCIESAWANYKGWEGPRDRAVTAFNEDGTFAPSDLAGEVLLAKKKDLMALHGSELMAMSAILGGRKGYHKETKVLVDRVRDAAKKLTA
jgi:hypothetical protein